MRRTITTLTLAATITAVSATTVAAQPSSHGTSAPASAASRCQTDHLRLGVHGVPGGLSHIGFAVVFRNRGARCTLDGYPGFDAVTAGGRTVHAKRTKSGYLGGARSIRPVVLGHGSAASAMYEGLAIGRNGRASACPRFTHLVVTPPNDTTSVRRSIRPARICDLQIHPVVPGTKGSQGG
jgi:hypothetical protein